MDTELIKNFIKPELLILIPVLYFVGMAIKNTLVIKDKFIPVILGLAGILLSVLWVLATADFYTTKDIFMAIFIAITQGLLCAGGAVYINQTYKQSQKLE